MTNEEMDLQPIENQSYTKNMFTLTLGDKYARAFHKIFYAPISEQKELMDKLYNESKEDSNLNDRQKRLIASSYIAYISATCEDATSIPIIAYVKDKQPVLSKYMKDKRLKRTVEDLYDIFYDNGFEFNVAYFPDMLRQFEYQYTNDQQIAMLNGGMDDEMVFQVMIMVAFGRLARASKLDIPTKWYIMIFFKRISQLTYLPPAYIAENPKIKDSIINIIKTVYIIQRLELKRSGVIEEKPATEE
jgi:hypothetical protein